MEEVLALCPENKKNDRTILEYYTIPELAALWKCSTDTIYSLLLKRQLKGFKVGRAWRVPDSARIEFETSPPVKANARPTRRKVPLAKIS